MCLSRSYARALLNWLSLDCFRLVLLTGGQLVERFREEAGLEISTGTLYPLLARLRKSGLVVTAWQESPVGPPRKIYKLAKSGKNRLLQMRGEWEALDCAVKRTTQKGIR